MNTLERLAWSNRLLLNMLVKTSIAILFGSRSYNWLNLAYNNISHPTHDYYLQAQTRFGNPETTRELRGKIDRARVQRAHHRVSLDEDDIRSGIVII